MDNNCTYKKIWRNDRIRELITSSIKEGDFRHSPKIADEVLNILDLLRYSAIKDNELIEKLRDYLICSNYNVMNDAEKVIKRVTQVKSLVDISKVGNYLDFGCGSGQVTQELSSEMTSAKYKLGVDTVNYVECNSHFIFCKYNRQELPIKNNTLEFATCFTVAHHLESMFYDLTQVFSVLKKGGVLLFREFDASAEEDKIFNKFMDELLFKAYLGINDVSIQDNYHSKEAWYWVLKSVGFREVDIHHFQEEENNPYKPFMIKAIK